MIEIAEAKVIIYMLIMFFDGIVIGAVVRGWFE